MYSVYVVLHNILLGPIHETFIHNVFIFFIIKS